MNVSDDWYCPERQFLQARLEFLSHGDDWYFPAPHIVHALHASCECELSSIYFPSPHSGHDRSAVAEQAINLPPAPQLLSEQVLHEVVE